MKTHGESGRRNGKQTPEYRLWIGLRCRCLNPKDKRYADYGGRGITVCERWQAFENFLADMWATRTEQNNNKRIHSAAPQAEFQP